MNAQTTIVHQLNTVSNEITIVDVKATPPLKKKKIILKITAARVKLFIWNLSPLHWYDDFKEIKINMDEFMCKKANTKDEVGAWK